MSKKLVIIIAIAFLGLGTGYLLRQSRNNDIIIQSNNLSMKNVNINEEFDLKIGETASIKDLRLTVVQNLAK